MSIVKMFSLKVGAISLLLALLFLAPAEPLLTEAGQGEQVTQVSNGQFFKFDKGATFAEMLTEPPHNIYGSGITLWVYRWEDSEEQETGIAEVLLTGHATSKVCMRGSISAYETALALPPQGSDLLAAGVAYFQGITPSWQAKLEQDRSVKEYRNTKATYGELITQRANLSTILNSISMFILFDDFPMIMSLAVWDDDTPLRMKICFLQGFLSKRLGLECEELLEQASIPIEEARRGFEDVSKLIKGFPKLRLLMTNYLDTLERLLQRWEEDPFSTARDPEPIESIEQAREAIGNWFTQKFDNLSERIKKLELTLDQLSEKEAVKEYLRSQSLEGFVDTFQRLEIETGLVTVKELDHEILADARAAIEQWVQYAASEDLAGPLVIWYQPLEDQEGAVLLPFYYITKRSDPNYLTIELRLRDFEAPEEALKTHQEALIKEVKEDAERRKDFYETQLKEFRDLREELQDADPTKLIPIYCSIDFENLRIECEQEPIEKVTVREYLINPRYLPGMIETAERLLREMRGLLKKIEEATQAQGRLTQINYAVVLDSFLRDWDLVFISREQGAAYDAWRGKRRDWIWKKIDEELLDKGVDSQILKQENVVFDISIEGDRVRIVPYFIADVSNLIFIIDRNKGIVQYIHPWGKRKKVKRDRGRMSQRVQQLLHEGEELEKQVKVLLRQNRCREVDQKFREAIKRYQQARMILAKPLIEEAQRSFEEGDIQAAVRTYKEALILDPRGTSEWLITKWRNRQVDTTQRLQNVRKKCESNPEANSFLEYFGNGWKHVSSGFELIQQGRLDEAEEELWAAIDEYQKAIDLISEIPDPYLHISLAYELLQSIEEQKGNEFQADEYEERTAEWKGKARAIDPGFVEEFEQAEGLIYSDAYRHLQELQGPCSFLNGRQRFEEGKYFKALEEYRKALRAKVELNELYQGLIDVYWELGMYKRALETAFLQLEDISQGLVIKTKPLQLVNNRLQFTLESGLKYEDADLKTLEVEVQEQGKSLVVRVNQQDILKVASSKTDDIEYLAQWLESLDPKQISNIGDTVADRLLNTEAPLFPAEEEFTELFLSPDGWGPLGQQLLKAMVYGGVKPSFITDSAVEEYLYPDLCSVEGKEDKTALLSHVQVVSQPGAILGARDYLYSSFWSSSEVVEAIKYPDTRAKIREEIIDKIPGQLISGNADGLAAALLIFQGEIGQTLSSDVRQALLADGRVLSKLGARIFFTNYPQITMLDVNVKSRTVYLLTKGEGDAVEVVETEPRLVTLLEDIKQRMGEHPARYVVEQLLSKEERELIRDRLVLPLVRHLNPRIEGDRIILDLQGKPFALRDLPENPVLRTLIPYFLRGNRLVYVAENSTAREIEKKLQALVDHTKLKFFVSLPVEYVGTPVEKLWNAEIEKLKAHISERKLGIMLEDLTGDDPITAKQKVQEALEEEDSLVFTFGHHPGTRALEIGLGGTFTHEDLGRLGSRYEPERFVAFVGCRGDVLAWPDQVVKKLGVLSFSFFEPFNADELINFLNAVVEELGKDPNARPQAIPFFLDIMEKLGLEKGGPVVQVPIEENEA